MRPIAHYESANAADVVSMRPDERGRDAHHKHVTATYVDRAEFDSDYSRLQARVDYLTEPPFSGVRRFTGNRCNSRRNAPGLGNAIYQIATIAIRQRTNILEE